MIRRPALLITGVLILVGVLVGGWLVGSLAAVSEDARPVWFIVEPGTSLGRVARDLDRAGLIRDTRAVRVYARMRGWGHRVRAGRYRLSGRESASEILAVLVRGETTPIRISFPEGIWLTEIAAVAADSLSVDSTAMVQKADDQPLLDRFDIPGETPEGYLFPATYDFEGNETAEEIVSRLLREGASRWTSEHAERARRLGMSRHEVLTLASIIEAETGREDERRKVSAVYHRRLDRGMLLQADPTIVFAIGTRGHGLTYADLELESPYNTYRQGGLPPTPIGSPGQAAIDAALDPDTTCTALYFVAQDDGSHVFSNTFDEHRAARRRSRSR